MFIDTHSHLTFPDYDKEREDIIKRAFEAGLEYIINIGSGAGLEDNFKSLELAKKNDNIFSTIGFHPHDAGNMLRANPSQTDESRSSRPCSNNKLGDSLELIEKLAEDPKVVAVGEIGLDYHYISKEKDHEKLKKDQIECFCAQIALANKLRLPVIIHDREAHDDTVFTLRKNRAANWGGVMHCFSGSTVLAKRVLDLGYYISVTGAVTFKKKSEELQAVVKYVPVEKLLIETDCPFIAPEPYRGKRNEPAYVVEVAKKIAGIKKLSLEDVGRITSLNAKKLFHLKGEIPDAKIVYPIRNSLYLNITNKCTLACTFCPKRNATFEVKGHNLKLSREPDIEDIFRAMGDPKGFEEVVFCGFGEPTQRFEILKVIAKRLKEDGIKVRLNTDGLANLIHQRNVLPELKGLVDSISVSLNAHNADVYSKICPSKYKAEAFKEVCDFIKEAKRYIPSVTATVVTCPEVDVEVAKDLAEKELGVTLCVREYQDVG